MRLEVTSIGEDAFVSSGEPTDGGGMTDNVIITANTVEPSGAIKILCGSLSLVR